VSTALVARKEFRDSVRSRWLWALTALFVLFTAGVAYAFGVLEGSGDGGSLGLLFFMQSPVTTVVPVAALVVTYKAVVGERDSGSLKLLLSLPHSRRDVVAGKVLGRASALGAGVLAGFAVALVVVVLQYPSFDPVAYGLFVGLTLAFGLTYVAIGVGMSAFVGSRAKALAGAIGLWVVLEFLWGVVAFGLFWVTNGFSLAGLDEGFPAWIQFVQTLSPGAAYSRAASALLPADPTATLTGSPAATPVYLEDWVGLVVLAAWLVLPPLVGYARFERAQLA
jgi:ABC-2 type transport system permease protein